MFCLSMYLTRLLLWLCFFVCGVCRPLIRFGFCLGSVQNGKLVLVDLAGSERVKKTGKRDAHGLASAEY